MIDVRLKDWATPKQVTYIDAVNEHGSVRAAARALKLKSDNSIRRSLKALKERAAAHGFAPESGLSHPIPKPFVAKGFSTLRDRHGEIVMQWEKTKLDDQLRLQAIMSGFEDAARPLERLEPLPPPTLTNANLLNLYSVSDYHLGMYAWDKESGQHWDLQRAEQVLVDAFEYMVMSAPPARVGFINQLGDFIHSDGLMPVTPTSGHILDQSARYSEIIQVAIRVVRRLVDFALRRHETVVLLMAEGNHDLSGAAWLRILFRTLYENEPRIEVVDSETPFYAYQFGKTMLAFHHGHKVKNDALPLLFATRHATMWGETTKRYAHVGHRHHVDEKEFSGMKVIQHPTLAAADSHSVREGYDSEQQTSVITYHATHGVSGRVFVTPEMLEKAA